MCNLRFNIFPWLSLWAKTLSGKGEEKRMRTTAFKLLILFGVLFVISCNLEDYKWVKVCESKLIDANFAYVNLDGKCTNEYWTLKFENNWVIKTTFGEKYIIDDIYSIYYHKGSDRYKAEHYRGKG